ncbi:MAG: hypothetical protein WCT10_04965 [Patescibacteria group bacterium]|jgi:hypothetical protein
MDTTRRNKLIRRWGVVLTIATAAFWIVWGLIFDDIPIINDLGLLPSYIELNRFSDILVAPVLVAVVLYFMNIPKRGSEFIDFVLDFRYIGLMTAVPAAIFLGFIWGLIAFIVVPLMFMMLTFIMLIAAVIMFVFIEYSFYAMRFLFSRRTWGRFGLWLIARDE